MIALLVVPPFFIWMVWQLIQIPGFVEEITACFALWFAALACAFGILLVASVFMLCGLSFGWFLLCLVAVPVAVFFLSRQRPQQEESSSDGVDWRSM